MTGETPKFLVIRRDNIGDLVCTTPLFSALRTHYPSAKICALVNSYNVAVLENNPDIDAVFAYTKAKHRLNGQNIFNVLLERARLLLKLRRMHFDYAILAGSPASVPRALKLARLLRPKHILAYTKSERAYRSGIDLPLPYPLRGDAHEVEEVYAMLAPLGILGYPPPLKVIADPALTKQVRDKISPQTNQMLVGVHISARKPSQRWPSQNFVVLMRNLAAARELAFVLFWSPGDEHNPLHPGDDSKAAEIMAALSDIPVRAFPTHRLQDLIAGLSLCDAVICSDGGAMHLAAGLGKPILCFFGKSSQAHWYPWGVSHVLLQHPSLDVRDINTSDACKGFLALLDKIKGVTGQSD